MPGTWMLFGSSSPTSTRCSTSATQILPQVAIIGLKLRAVSRNTRLPRRSPFHAFTMERSAVIASSSTYSLPSNTLVSLPSASLVPNAVRV